MWRCKLTELNWVSTKIRFNPELMQFDIGISINRYLPAIGTAGLLRVLVNGKSRVPRPPPRISEITRGIALPSFPLVSFVDIGPSRENPWLLDSRDPTRILDDSQ